MDQFLFYKLYLCDSQIFANNSGEDRTKPENLKVVYTLLGRDVQSIYCITSILIPSDVAGVRQ